MADEGLTRIGRFVDNKGNVVGKMFAGRSALSDDADIISQCLYLLTETLVRGLVPDQRGGGMGGEFGYGANFENDVFMMHRYCWCEKDDCKWCSLEAPNFLHKKSGLAIRWYKWIGRDMKMEPKTIGGQKWQQIFRECFDSIPKKARQRAKAEHDFENTPEFIAQRESATKIMFEVMEKMERESPVRKRVCNSCGKEYEYKTALTVLAGSCDECMKARFNK